MIENLWDPVEAEQLLTPLSELRYRSNLLGTDRAVCNWGGGNTSVKSTATDFRGRKIDVMWVKGSGSDLASMTEKNFTALRLDDIQPLLEREEMTDEEMVSYLRHCMVDASDPRPSIETLLHAFLPFPHIDHTHPDAIISICCAPNGREIADQIFGNRYVWVPYVRPGFQLSKMIAEGVRSNPTAELVLMEKHGLVVWGETSKQCYDQTIQVINEAQAYIDQRLDDEKAFGGRLYESIPKEKRDEIVAGVLPAVRGYVSVNEGMIVTYDDSEEVMEFVNGRVAEKLSQIGAACPDHLVHTKRTPLFIRWEPDTQDEAALLSKLKEGIAAYQEEYSAYFRRYADGNEQMFNPSPRIILIPGVGMLAIGKDFRNANISRSLYYRAIAVMKGADAIGGFQSLNERESFDIEYWPLELYKLTLAPKEAEFSRKIAFVTGGAGGIGRETCRFIAAQGGHVVIADLNAEGAQNTADEINKTYGMGKALAVKMDVTSEKDIREAFKKTILKYGGLDILVSNAGLATSSPFEETTLQEWNLNMNVLGTGYFLVSREAFTIMKQQNGGGSIIFVGSKNAIYAGKNASAYSAVKALEIHLARCIAAEGGDYGIRVNSVLPDAVLQGSAIWNSAWREERASAYGIHPDELDEYYRQRTVLKENVFPKDIAEAIVFFASQKSSKTTGCMLTVDGGVTAAFTR